MERKKPKPRDVILYSSAALVRILFLSLSTISSSITHPPPVTGVFLGPKVISSSSEHIWWAPTRCVQVSDKRLRTPEPKSISEKTPNSSDCFQNLNSHRSSRWLQGSSIKKVNLYSILLHLPLFCDGNLPKSVKFRTYLLKDSLGKASGIHTNFSKKSTWRYLRVAKELDAHILRFWSTHEYYKCAWYELQTPPHVRLRLIFRFRAGLIY